MNKYVIALFITNTFYYILGNPLSGTFSPPAKSLLLLANNCGNPFLSTQIKENVDACNISLSAQSETLEADLLECLIFYDINTQLCTAFHGSNLDLSQTYATKVNKSITAEVTCNVSKNWNFSKLTDYPMYNAAVKFFKNPVICIKVCGVIDVLSDDTNFYCKYFQWGTELLLHHKELSVPSFTGNMPSGESRPVLETAPAKVLDSSSVPTSTNNINVPKPQSSKEQPLNPQSIANVPIPPIEAAPSSTKGEQKENKGAEISSVPGQNTDNQPTQVIDNSTKNEAPLKDISPKKKSENVSLIGGDENNQINKPSDDLDDGDENFVDTDPEDDNLPDGIQVNSEGDSDVKNDPNDAKLKEKPKSTPNKNPSVDMTPRDSKGNPESLQGNVENDLDLDSDPYEVRLDKEKNKSPDKKISSNEGAPKEYYSNTMQDGFVEDDDHFFSFFLTAIILVIFLYVLYHNKSKFRKVLLGLLVEGRQSGRRRNSRGHEYRRLDNLEQVMSTNSAAPPSKIIY